MIDMAVVPEFPILQIQDETQVPNRTYKLDFDKGRIIGYVDGEDALQQAAAKALYTPRFDCFAYDDQYGSEINSLLGNPDVTREYLESEMEFILKDTLCQDGRFSGIDDLEIQFESDEAFFSFILNTVLGQIQIEGVTNGV